MNRSKILEMVKEEEKSFTKDQKWFRKTFFSYFLPMEISSKKKYNLLTEAEKCVLSVYKDLDEQAKKDASDYLGVLNFRLKEYESRNCKTGE